MTLRAAGPQGGQTFNNPNFTGVQTGNTWPLGFQAIPFISLSSGSVSAAGAITAITALPVAYPNAYCYFPANALATVKAAGWYYCTFSTTTAGTAFLDTWTTGTPVIPVSPTPVTDGKGAFTGDTTEEFGPAITVPAGALGISGQLEIVSLWSAAPNNANAKTPRVRFSGNGGTQVGGGSLTSQIALQNEAFVANRGKNSAQIVTSTGISGQGGYGVTGGTNHGFLAVDTSVATTVVFSLQKATATDNMVLEMLVVRVNS